MTNAFEDFRPDNADPSVLEEDLGIPLPRPFFNNFNPKKVKRMSDLHVAAYSGNTAKLSELLTEGSNVNAVDEDYGTPLLLAIHSKRFEVIRALIKAGADLHSGVPQSSPLECAVESDFFDAVKILVEHGANVKSNTSDDLTLLHRATVFSSQNLVLFLIDEGLDLKAKCRINNKTGWTPLHLAANRGAPEIVKLLLSKKAGVNVRESERRFSPLHYAAAKGHLKVVKMLVNAKADVNAKAKQNCTALHLAVLGRHFEVAKFLLQNGADADVQDDIFKWTPLHMSSVLELDTFAKLLLKHKANLKLKDHYRRTVLHFAVERLKEDVVELVISKMGRLELNARNAEGIAPLHIAIAFDRPDSVKLLLKNGAFWDAELYGSLDPAPIDLARHNEMPEVIHIFELCQTFFNAAIKGDCDELKRCIKKGAIVSVINSNGQSPLLFAISNGHKKAIDLLLANGADLTVVTIKCNTTLHVAVVMNNDDIIETILEHSKKMNSMLFKYFINCKTAERGMTALHVAASKNNILTVKRLLERGAVFNPLNKNGKTPSELSTDKSIKKLFKTLDELFHDAKKGNQEFVTKLENVDNDTIKAVSCARNSQDENLFEILRANKHERLAGKYTEITIKKFSGGFFNCTVHAVNF